jgi:hypothetical protein
MREILELALWVTVLTNLLVWAFDPLETIRPDFKPFNCVKCLSIWIGLIFGMIFLSGPWNIVTLVCAGFLGSTWFEKTFREW